MRVMRLLCATQERIGSVFHLPKGAIGSCVLMLEFLNHFDALCRRGLWQRGAAAAGADCC
jgi:hypothetical protein